MQEFIDKHGIKADIIRGDDTGHIHFKEKVIVLKNDDIITNMNCSIDVGDDIYVDLYSYKVLSITRYNNYNLIITK